MSTRMWVVGAAVGALMLTGCQQPAAFTPQDEAAIHAMFDKTPGYVVSGDFTTWAAQFSDNALLQPPNASAVTGRPALLAWMKAFPPLAELKFSNVQIAGDGNVGWGSSAWTLKTKDGATDSGKQLIVARRSAAGKWEFVAGAFNSDLPLPAPAKPAKK